MYYSTELFVRKGALGMVWIAGNFLSKLSKQTILSANIAGECAKVLHSETPLALPAQSMLLRGIVRIENKKAGYLSEEAQTYATQIQVRERARAAQIEEKQFPQARIEISLGADESARRTLEDEFLRRDLTEDLDLLMLPFEFEEVAAELDEQRLELSQPSEAEMEAAPHVARAEEITMTPQAEGRISEMEMPREGERIGYELMEEEEIPLPPPSPAVPMEFERFASPIPLEERKSAVPQEAEEKAKAEAAVAPSPPKKKKSIFRIDERSEMSNADIQAMLAEEEDLMIERPRRAKSAVELAEEIEEKLCRPSIVPEGVEIADELRDMFYRATAGDAKQYEAKRKQREKEEKQKTAERRRAPHAPAAEELEAFVPPEEEALFPPEELPLEVELAREAEEKAAEIGVRRSFLGRPLESPMEAARRISRVPLEEIPSQPAEVTISEYELKKEELTEKEKLEHAHIEAREVDMYTRAFREGLEEEFNNLDKQKPNVKFADQTVDFESLLADIAVGDITQVDRAIAFYQLLVHKSLDIIRVKQTRAYADISITRGPQWEMRFTEMSMSQ